MLITKDSSHEKDQFGITTKILAGICHNCGICPYAHKRATSVFGRLMRWHRGWCKDIIRSGKNIQEYLPLQFYPITAGDIAYKNSVAIIGGKY